MKKTTKRIVLKELTPLKGPITILQENNKILPNGERGKWLWENIVAIKPKDGVKLPQATRNSPGIELFIPDPERDTFQRKVTIAYFRSVAMRNAAVLHILATPPGKIISFGFREYFETVQLTLKQIQECQQYSFDKDTVLKQEKDINKVSPIEFDFKKFFEHVPWGNLTDLITTCCYLFGSPIEGIPPDLFWYNYFSQ